EADAAVRAAARWPHGLATHRSRKARDAAATERSAQVTERAEYWVLKVLPPEAVLVLTKEMASELECVNGELCAPIDVYSNETDACERSRSIAGRDRCTRWCCRCPCPGSVVDRGGKRAADVGRLDLAAGSSERIPVGAVPLAARAASTPDPLELIGDAGEVTRGFELGRRGGAGDLGGRHGLSNHASVSAARMLDKPWASSARASPATLRKVLDLRYGA